MKSKLKLIILVMPVALSSQAFAEASISIPDKTFSTDISLGVLSGKTKERVYEPEEGGRKVSQLDWKYSNAPIIKGTMQWYITERVTVNASGWTTFSSRDGNMVDTDWSDADNPNLWTDKSVHPNSKLNYANEFDLSLIGWIFNEPDYRFGLVTGYQESRYSFNAGDGGSYIYSSEDGFRDEIGQFPFGERSIGYKQRFKVPYVGLTGYWRYGDAEISGVAKYSGWSQSTDNDEHYDRNITFRSKVKNQNFFSVSANAGYYISPNSKIYVEGAWSRITNKKGDVSLYDREDNIYESIKSGSGIENYNFLTTIGIKHTF